MKNEKNLQEDAKIAKVLCDITTILQKTKMILVLLR
jgi:hypothetical protein